MNVKARNNPIDNNYRTSDLPLSAVLFLFGYPITGIDRTDPRRAVLQFERNENLDDLVVEYWRNQISVEPQQYFQALKTIKSRIYNDV